MRSYSYMRQQGGSALIEALVAVLVFSFGILALVSMQTAAIKSTADAKYRADASFLANQIIGQMWGVAPVDLAAFVNGPAVAAAACSAGAAAATNGIATDWLDSLPALLPGAANDRQMISVVGDVVTVRVCWLDRSDAVAAGTYHNHVVSAQINKNI